MSIVSITAVNCNRCGKAVSPAVACEEPLVVRAWVECPECIQQDEPHLAKLTAAQAKIAELEKELAEAIKAINTHAALASEADTRAERQTRRADSYARTAKAALDSSGPALVEARERIDSLSSALTATEAEREGLKEILRKVEAWLIDDPGPVWVLYRYGEIGEKREWKDVLEDLRNPGVDVLAICEGTPWTAVLLYREIWLALHATTALTAALKQGGSE